MRLRTDGIKDIQRHAYTAATNYATSDLLMRTSVLLTHTDNNLHESYIVIRVYQWQAAAWKCQAMFRTQRKLLSLVA